MKILEGRPRSYDRRIDRISRGRVREMKLAMVQEIPTNAHVLDIGCGAGELAMILARNGASVEGFDINPHMVVAAREKIEVEGMQKWARVFEMGVEDMDRLSEQAYDAVVSTLVFSELTDGERCFALNQAFRILKPGGQLIITDEVTPRTWSGRLLHALVRLPMLALTYLAIHTSTTPLADLPGEVTAAGFEVITEVHDYGEALAVLTAERPLTRNSIQLPGESPGLTGGG